ncbi:amidase [Bosea lathyri]|uniref:Aspartyl-tRNA(Asn)/glutamyl-tRNA(Gln) amidotransferase subunit A n=1 Tax=Bosea lathyri TaxID=1036778 RepID=A0A1H5TST2_9HYPH|nr:amidase [Bosea lathyri]SEF65830.1 aspartyl-tRNA(Asn)/glutamyl-tRNA(Gln) amidotransferase subunit A [Bosea lathyri]
MTTIASFSAVELGKLYADRELSPVEVAKDALDRIERFEPDINAFVVRDAEITLNMAEASQARWLKGAPLGPLDGVPVTIKDNIGVAGWPMRRGSALASSAPWPEDSPATARLREAGTVFLGKTTMPEYGWKGVGDSPLSGITRNPWDIATGPGGSSSGAAACAALNLGCIHIGTDGAGSVRIPAAFTGVVGLKPSYGRVPAYPVSTMGFLAHLGPLTRTVTDTALAMNTIGRPDNRDMTAMIDEPPDYVAALAGGVKGLRMAWSPRLGGDVTVDPEIAALTRAAAMAFRDLGATVEEVDPGFDDPIETLMTIWSSGAALALRSASAADRERMDPGLVAVAEQGERIPASGYVDALLNQRNALAHHMAQFHARFDLLLTPTLPLPAFAVSRNTPGHGAYGEDWTRWTPFTYPFNITQAPAISLPCGLTAAGLPAGLQLVGAFGRDALVLRAAAAFENLRPFARVDAPVKTV